MLNSTGRTQNHASTDTRADDPGGATVGGSLSAVSERPAGDASERIGCIKRIRNSQQRTACYVPTRITLTMHSRHDHRCQMSMTYTFTASRAKFGPTHPHTSLDHSVHTHSRFHTDDLRERETYSVTQAKHSIHPRTEVHKRIKRTATQMTCVREKPTASHKQRTQSIQAPSYIKESSGQPSSYCPTLSSWSP